MIDLYGMQSPNVVKINIMLEETGLAYRSHFVDVLHGGQFDPAFIAISPTKKVPVLVDPDGPDGQSIRVIESGAILIYLAEKTGKFMPSDLRGRTSVMEWLMVQMSLIGPMSGQATHFTRIAPPGNDYPRERYYSQCANAHRLLDERLAETPYLAGDDCSIADFATWPWINHALKLFPWFKDDASRFGADYPHLKRWFDAMAARPGVIRSQATVAEMTKTNPPSMDSADGIDRLVLRGQYSATPA